MGMRLFWKHPPESRKGYNKKKGAKSGEDLKQMVFPNPDFLKITYWKATSQSLT